MIPLRSEWRRMTSSKTAVALLLMFVITPVVLLGTLLWSQWSPMARSPKVPAAIVNQDQPVSQGGQQVAAGDQLTTAIMGRGEMEWSQTNADDAEQGLRSGRYFAVVTIPADYSANIDSLSTASPRGASINIKTNDATSVLTPVVAYQALQTVDVLAEQQVQTGYLDAVYAALGSGKASTNKSLTQAQQLLKDAQTANAAATRAAQQSSAAASQAAGQQSSANSTADSAVKSRDSAAAANDATGALPNQAKAISTGAGQVTDDLKALQAALTAAGQQDFAAQAAQIAAENQANVNAPAAGLTNDASAAAQQTATAASDTGDTAQIAAATNTAASTTTQSVQQAADASKSAATATTTTVNSAQTHAAALQEFAQRVPPALANQKEAYSKVLNEPVDTAVTRTNAVRATGDGITSQFVPAALLLGALGTFMFVPALLPRLRMAGVGWFRLVFASAVFPLAVSLAQVVLIFGGLYLMGLRAAAWLPLVGMVLLTAVCSVAIIQLLRAWFGALGTFLALLFILLQLAAGAGALPGQAQSGIYSYLEPFMPMTYAADGIRRSIAGGDLLPFLLIDAGVLLVVTLVAWGLTGVVARRRRGVLITDIRPAIAPV